MQCAVRQWLMMAVLQLLVTMTLLANFPSHHLHPQYQQQLQLQHYVSLQPGERGQTQPLLTMQEEQAAAAQDWMPKSSSSWFLLHLVKRSISPQKSVMSVLLRAAAAVTILVATVLAGGTGPCTAATTATQVAAAGNCEPPCVHGTCDASSVCVCDAGYAGPTCSGQVIHASGTVHTVTILAHLLLV